MSISQPIPHSSGVLGFFENNPTVTISFAVLLALLVGGLVLRKGSTTTGTGTTSDTSGVATDANGNKVVYVPTSTSFNNYNVGSNDNGPVSIGSTSSPIAATTTPIKVSNPPKVVIPIVAPPKTTVQTPVRSTPIRYGLVWGALHVVMPGDTLTYIASQSSMIMRTQQHAPGSTGISASDIRAHNPGVSDPPKVGSTIKLPSYERISG